MSPFVPIPILRRSRQAPPRLASLVFPTSVPRVPRTPSGVNQDSSSLRAGPRTARAALPAEYRAISEICVAGARMEEVPLRYAAAPRSGEEDRQRPVPRLLARRLRSPRLHLAVGAFPKAHDTSVSATRSAQWAQTSQLVRARTAGSVCGKLQPRADPAGHKARKSARHRTLAAAPGNIVLH